ncbi:MAG: GNAT family N-acetyltransferase [Bacillota bacterium]
MKIEIFEFCDGDIKNAINVWNEVVSDGIAFPQVDCLDVEGGLEFFAQQSFVGVAKVVEDFCVAGDFIGKDSCGSDDVAVVKNAFSRSAVDKYDISDGMVGDIVGLYILHPNNIGRCGHICNASYAVSSKFRGLGIGEMLVSHCISKAGEIGFGILQFNAVVATNTPALNLYKKLGFTKMAVIPKGFRLDDSSFVDIVPHFIEV